MATASSTVMPEPVHAGIDVQRRAAAPVLGRRRKHPIRQARSALLITGRRLALGERSRGARHQAVEHVDDGVRRDRAHAPAFGDVGDEERPAAGLGELRCDRLEPQP